jgi:hypothetical protein
MLIHCRAPEPQIMDYQAQQNKIFPPLAAIFAFHFASDHLWNLYNTANSRIDQGDLELVPEVSPPNHELLHFIRIAGSLNLTKGPNGNMLLRNSNRNSISNLIAATRPGLCLKSHVQYRKCQFHRSVASVVRRSRIHGQQQLPSHLFTDYGSDYLRG